MALYVIMGVAGCGKSSIGRAIATQISAEFIDGDDLHPQANIDKMSAGDALTDEDRAPWLHAVGHSLSNTPAPCIIACSALKKAYRDIIRTSANAPVTFLHLHGSRQVIEDRMSAREGHFMPVSLLDSQFATLEPLDESERHYTVDIDQPFAAVVDAFVTHLKG
jgi:gluconokinase